jgi:DNA primase
LLYDSDEAGLKATFRAGDQLLRLGVSVQVVTLPEGEDPDTFVRAHGKEWLEEHVAQAIDVFERKIQLLERGGWFADLRRKRKALDRLLPTLRAVSDPITRDLYIARTAEAAGVSRDLLEREIGHGPEAAHGGAPEPPPEYFDAEPESQAPPRAPRRDPRRDAGVRTEWELVRIMLHRRSQVEFVAERAGPQDFHEPSLRAIYARMAAAISDPTVGDLAEGLDERANAVLQQLLAEDGGLDDVERTVQDCLAKLHLKRLREEREEIDRQLPLASDADKTALISRKQVLAEESRSLGGRDWPTLRHSRS